MMSVVNRAQVRYRVATGDIFASGCRIITIPVNGVGVMGKGLALEAKQRFPGCYAPYVDACRGGRMAPGSLLLWQHPADPLQLLCFPTKRHWRDASRLDDIEAGLAATSRLLEQTTADTAIAIPALGCGLGGLPWSDVEPMIRHHLLPTGRPIVVYPPR